MTSLPDIPYASGYPIHWTRDPSGETVKSVVTFHRALISGAEVSFEHIHRLAHYAIYFASAPRWLDRTHNEDAIEFSQLMYRFDGARSVSDLRDALLLLAIRFKLNPFTPTLIRGDDDDDDDGEPCDCECCSILKANHDAQSFGA